MATIRKGGKSWLAEVRLKGVEARQSFPTKGEAKSWSDEIERKVRAGKGGSVSNRIMRDAFERYGEEVTPKKPSHKWESTRLLWLASQPFATKRMNEIKTPDLVAWRDALPAAGFEDTLLRCDLKPEVVDGNQAAVQQGIQIRGGEAGQGTRCVGAASGARSRRARECAAQVGS